MVISVQYTCPIDKARIAYSYFEKGCRKNCARDNNTLVLDTVAVEPTFVVSFSPRKHTSMASRAILLNFFEEQWTKNHPQRLSGLSRALFPTTFLETAV